MSQEHNEIQTSGNALHYHNFRLFLVGLALWTFGEQMIIVAVGWDLYTRTHSALVLGGVGLAQMLPLILLFLPAGYIIDHFSRKSIVLAANIAMVIGSLSLALTSFQHGSYLLIYLCLIAMGTSASFSNPASSALAAHVIPKKAFENAMTYTNSTGQLFAVVGPAAGGFLIGLLGGVPFVYLIGGGCFLISVILTAFIRVVPHKTNTSKGRKLGSLLGGVHFLMETPVLLAAITLDLFAVLFGGATTLLPIFAQNILHVGPLGFGWLQAASSLGAVCMALVLTYQPPFKKAGRSLLLAVAGFGAATIVFGLSRWFWLSFLMLFALGALDNISMIIRSTLVLVRTPNETRGRVNSINSLFIGTSNQLGGFESGLIAQFFGPVVSVVAGGIGTLLVVSLVAGIWPEMRRLGKLQENPTKEEID